MSPKASKRVMADARSIVRTREPLINKAIGGRLWENRGEAARCVNTERPLTHPLDLTEEGLAMKATRTCAAESCDRPVYAKGWCGKHYQRCWTHGDPNGGRVVRTAEERFWTKVDKSAGPSGCWTWTAGKGPRGYGVFHPADGVSVRANRWALAWALGRPIAAGMESLHSCDNPPCVNPAHLREGTRQDNIDDAIERGRHTRGTKVRNAVLSDSKVLTIRQRFAAGESTEILAREHGVAQATIRKAVRGRTWKHVSGPLLSPKARRWS